MYGTRYGIKHCCFPGCSTSSFDGDKSLFRFPKDIERCSKWKQFVGDDRYQNYTPEECYNRLRLCNLHFHSSSFPIFSKNRLKRNAVPKLVNDMIDASATDNSLPSTSAIAFTEDPSRLEQASTSSYRLMEPTVEINTAVKHVTPKNIMDSQKNRPVSFSMGANDANNKQLLNARSKLIRMIKQISLDHCYAAPFHEVEFFDASMESNNFTLDGRPRFIKGSLESTKSDVDDEGNVSEIQVANSVEAVYVKKEVADVPEAPLNFDDVQELGIPTIFPARRNIEQICILCGSSNESRKSNSVIIHFADLIKDFSGVDILKYNCPATACATCFKIVLELWNFKQQIIDSVKYVEQKFADQKNQTENATNFEYVECKIETEEQEVINDCTLEPAGNENVIKLVPIENLVKDSKTKGNCFKCTKCGNSIPGRFLKFHDCTQAGTTQNYICPVCGRWYSNYKTLKRHEVTHKAKKHTCKICGDAFYNDFSLIQHTRKHTGSKPFVCPYCNRCFSVRWNFLQHKRMHTNNMPFKCKLCSETFRLNIALKKHLARAHADVDPTVITDDSTNETCEGLKTVDAHNM